MSGRQHVKIRRIERDVARGDDQHAAYQRARNRALGFANFFGGIRHHVPAAKGKQAGDDSNEKMREREWGRSAAGVGSEQPRHVSRRAAEREHDRDDGRDRRNLEDRERGLHQAPLSHANVVDSRERNDRRAGNGAEADVADGHEKRQVAREHHRDHGDDAGVHRPEHRPAPEKTKRRRERFLEEDVHAAGVRIGRGQFGGNQRAEQREDAGCDPHRVHGADAGNRAGDDRRLDEDRRADDDADDERGRLKRRDRSREHGAGKGARRSAVLPVAGTAVPLRGRAFVQRAGRMHDQRW